MTDEDPKLPPVVNVTSAARPVVLWQCPACDAKLEGSDPNMITHLARGGRAGVTCRGCGAEVLLQMPKIVTPNEPTIVAGPNRKQRRNAKRQRRVKLN